MVGDILQPTHLLFVLVVALLVLGPKRLPEVGRAIGDGLRDFRSAINGEGRDHHDEIGHGYGPEGSEDEPKHGFAADSSPPAHGHEFPAPTPRPAGGDHEFAHQEPAADGHEGSVGDPATADPASKPHREVADPGGEHEFAYEHSDPAGTRDKPAS